MKYVTYRIGFDNHMPLHRTGAEITEATDLNLTDFLDETELALGEISLLWMGTMPMPGGHQV